MSFKAFALSLLMGAAMAVPVASPVEVQAADIIVERAPAATSASGTTPSTVSCPGSNSTTFNANGVSFVVECGFDRPGNMGMVYTSNFATCIDTCAATSGCVDVSYVSNGGGACYMKSSISTPNYGNTGVWGARKASGSASSTPSSTKATSAAPTSTTKTSTLATSTIKTSTIAPTSTVTGTATSGKRGLAYNTASYASLFTSSPEVTWGYNWGQSSSGLSTHFDYSPMLWCSSPSYTSGWASNVKAAVAAGSSHLLGFNEPDNSGQCNISPSAAAAAWKTYMQPYASSNVKLVSPAVTNGGGESGLQWMSEFLGNCTGCTVDVIALHWYSSYAPDFQNHVESAYSMFGKPIWVTEFGLTSSTDAQIESFLESVMPWMDSTSYVQRYAYFGVFTGYLLSSATALSDYGSIYASYT